MIIPFIFFNAESAVKIKMEEHYALSQETMFAHFGRKWVSLNCWPMWQYDEEEDLIENENAPSGDILAEALNSAGIQKCPGSRQCRYGAIGCQ